MYKQPLHIVTTGESLLTIKGISRGAGASTSALSGNSLVAPRYETTKIPRCFVCYLSAGCPLQHCHCMLSSSVHKWFACTDVLILLAWSKLGPRPHRPDISQFIIPLFKNADEVSIFRNCCYKSNALNRLVFVFTLQT